MTMCLLAAHAQDSFNYNKWKAEQERKNNPDKESVSTTSEENLFKDSYFYVQPAVQITPFKGPSLSVGGCFHHVNLGADFVYGLTESYQIRRYIDSSYHGYTYSPYSLGVKLGYDFIYKGCLAMTPQIGIKQMFYYGQRANEVSEKASETGTASTFSCGLHLSYAFTRHLAITLTPEYDVVVAKSDLYQTLVKQEGGDDIRRWAENLNVKVGVSLRW